MNATETRRLVQAARTAVSLIGLVHQTLWDLFPNEMLLLQESDEDRLLDAIGAALKTIPEPDPPLCRSHAT